MDNKFSNADEFLKFIEKASGIELYPYQKIFLKFLYDNPSVTTSMNPRIIDRDMTYYNIKRMYDSILNKEK